MRYTLRQIKDGTGFRRDATFMLLPSGDDDPAVEADGKSDELIDHLLEGHEETARDLIDWLISDLARHPDLTVHESLIHLHDVQHSGEDWHPDHDHMIYDPRFRS